MSLAIQKARTNGGKMDNVAEIGSVCIGFTARLFGVRKHGPELRVHFDHHMTDRDETEIGVRHVGEGETEPYYVLKLRHEESHGTVFLSPAQLRDLVDAGSRALAENGDYELLEWIPMDDHPQPRRIGNGPKLLEENEEARQR